VNNFIRIPRCLVRELAFSGGIFCTHDTTSHLGVVAVQSGGSPHPAETTRRVRLTERVPRHIDRPPKSRLPLVGVARVTSLEQSVPCQPGVASTDSFASFTESHPVVRVAEWERPSKTACGVTLFGLYKSFCQVSRAQMARLAQRQATLALFRCKSSRRKTWACNTWSNPPCTPHMHLVGSPSGTTRGDRLCAWSTPFATIIVCECAHRTSLRSHDTPRAEVLLTTHQYSMHTHTHTHAYAQLFSTLSSGLGPWCCGHRTCVLPALSVFRC
jgi:hypothetical protein